MLRTIINKVANSGLTVLIAITAIFVLVRLAPGGPLDGERILPESTQAELMRKWRLDLPVHEQYFHFLRDLASFDLGPSYRHQGRTVQSLILEGLPTTMLLGGTAMAFAILIGVVLGVIAAVRHNRPIDYGIMAVAMIGVAVPEFVIGPLLQLVFAMWLKLLPVTTTESEWPSLRTMVLPVATLTVYYSAIIARMTRGKMLEVLQLDYIRTARAKGVPEWKVMFVHALRGGITATVTYAGVATAGVLSGGTIVAERLFGVPGIGKYFIDAALSANHPLVIGTGIVFLVMLIIMNQLVDFIHKVLDPRQRR